MKSYLFLFLVAFSPMMMRAQFQKTIPNNKVLQQQKPIKQVPTGIKTVPGVTPGNRNPVAVMNLGGGKYVRTEMIRDATSLPLDDQYRSQVTARTPSAKSNASWNCNNISVKFSAESKSFMSADKNQASFPVGSIYRFEDLFSGNMNEISAGRRPFIMYTDNLRSTGPRRVEVTNPTASNIFNTLGNIIQPFSNDVGGASLIYRTFTSESEADFKMKISAGGYYASFQANASYDYNTYTKHVYLTFDIIKPMFKVYAERPNDGFFTDPSIAANNPNYVYLKEVEYGARMLVNLDIIIENKDDIAKISASYGMGDTTKKSFSASMDVISKLKAASTTVNAYIIGAPQSVTIFNNTTAVNKDKLQEEISALLAKCNYGSAVPISYKVADMNGQTIGVKSVTDEFVYPECTPAASVFTMEWARLSITTGNDNKETPSTYGVGLVVNQVPDPNFQNPTVMIASSPNSEHIAEIGVNQEDVFPLVKAGNFPANMKSPFQMSSMVNGGYVSIHYYPNFGLDAWRIQSVILTMRFVDQNNTPILKTIRFNSIDKLMTNNLRTLELQFSGAFEPVG